MESAQLHVELRKPGMKAAQVRHGKRIPAVFYGGGHQNLQFSMDYEEFRRVYAQAGESTIIELMHEDKQIPVLVQELQRHPVTDRFSHVDFIFVDMTKEVTTHVPVRAVGEAPAVKNLGGTLTTLKHEVEIRCLPKYLIHSIEVDVSGLEDFHAVIHVKDLKVVPEITILDHPDATVMAIAAPRAEEEETPAVPEAPVEGGEGAAPAEGEKEAEKSPEKQQKSGDKQQKTEG